MIHFWPRVENVSFIIQTDNLKHLGKKQNLSKKHLYSQFTWDILNLEIFF